MTCPAEQSSPAWGPCLTTARPLERKDWDPNESRLLERLSAAPGFLLNFSSWRMDGTEGSQVVGGLFPGDLEK